MDEWQVSYLVSFVHTYEHCHIQELNWYRDNQRHHQDFTAIQGVIGIQIRV